MTSSRQASGRLDALLMDVPSLAGAAAQISADRTAGRLAVARPAWSFVLAALLRTTERALIAVCPEDDEARDLALELEAILGRAAVALYPSRGVPLAGPVGAAPHLVGQRARALASAERPATIVVAGAPALAELIAPRAVWAEPMHIDAGATSPIEDVLDRLAGSATSARPRSRSAARSRCAAG